ncbi:hypothetical protein GPECTOR_32g520 [Gonium pectorale]|uniref:Uncharacterized protein n=1 Tax=Gonium pectorale TaxID=33097 RepID=A0A150GDI2_GONPE|nr:hypothetical protein GPECTOR_32g520 [Gonium pectorale]|eukprot:KXZ47907.1 hypothetical protein GPECTOR_32g520 [Gonium pectorale]
MTSRQVVTHHLRELVSSGDVIVKLSDTDTDKSGDGAMNRRFQAHDAARDALYEQWEQVGMRTRNANKGVGVAVSLDWIQSCVDTGVVPWLSRVFKLIPSKVSYVQDGAAQQGARRNAASLLNSCGPSAFMMLACLLDPLFNVVAYGDAQQQARAQQLLALLLARDFMVPAAAAFHAWTLFTVYLALPSTRDALEAGGGYDAIRCLVHAVGTRCKGALFSARYAQIASTLLVNRMNTCGLATSGTAAPLPAPVAELVDALSSSGLVPVAAGMILQPPLVVNGVPIPWGPGIPYPKNRTAIEIHAAAREVSIAMNVLQGARARLVGAGGSTSAPGVAQLGRLLEHRKVAALRHVMLQRLAAHGRLQPQPPEEGVAAEGGADGAEDAYVWWLTRKEVQDGPVTDRGITGFDDRTGNTAGWLEDDHCHAVLVSLGYWRGTELRELPPDLRRRLAPPASAPPPEVIARLAARTAEALCRLYHGQGLGGAYGPGAPEWLFARNAGALVPFDFSDEASAAPEAELQACLPHWLEAAAWGLALGVEALAGAVERRGVSHPNATHGGMLLHESQLGNEATGPERLLQALTLPSSHATRNVKMSSEVRADLSARLRRAGLGASLDRALRLAFTVFDRAEAPGATEWERSAANILMDAPFSTASILGSQLLPMLGPTGAAVEGGGVSGVLVTAAKRASALARQLEELVEAGAGGGETPMAKLVRPSTLVLDALARGFFALREELRKR